MVKKYLNLKTRRTGYLPAINSRRFGGKHFASMAYKSDGGEDDNSEDEVLNGIEQQVKQFNDTLGDKADKSAVDAVKTELEALREAIKAQDAAKTSAAIKAINEANTKLYKQLLEDAAEKQEKERQGNPKAPYTNDALKAFASEMIASKKGGTVTDLEINAHITNKAAETFGYPQTFVEGTDISAFTGRMVDPTLYQPRRKTNIILDYMPIRPISVPTLIYLNKIEEGNDDPIEGDPGSADWIACGDLKPKRSFRVGSQEVQAKKVAIFGTIEDCLLQDVPSFDNWIRTDFREQMDEAINDGLLNGNPTVDPLLPLGMKTNAVQYAPTPAYVASVEEPNYIDAIIAVAAFFAFNRENLSQVFVSSDVWYRIMHLKDNDHRYLNNDKVYTNALGELVIAGVRVIKADEEDVPSTNILAVGAESGFRIYAYGNMVIERGLNGEDFREDKTSYRGYQRFISYIPEDRENSVMYDTWANIFAAINKPTTT